VRAAPRFAPAHAEAPLDLPAPFVALAPAVGAFSSARAWPLERYIELAVGLVAAGYAVVVLGGKGDHALGARVVAAVDRSQARNIAGQTTPNQLALVLARSAGLVGNDSFPVHLAAALGVPALAIFGPTNREAWAPRSENAQTLSLELPCSPCLYTGYRLGRRAGCPARSCLTMITAAMALERTLEMLGA
jgi:heptosyltransferase-2